MLKLEKFERVETDDGYDGESPMYVKFPKSFSNPNATEFMQQQIQNRQETINPRFKNWGILKKVYCHDLSKHCDVFLCNCGNYTNFN